MVHRAVFQSAPSLWLIVERRPRAPVIRRRQVEPSANSTRLMRQRKLKTTRYCLLAQEVMTTSTGASTLYSSVKTSQPMSPWLSSRRRASRRRRTSGESYCALEPRMAWSSWAVRVWRYCEPAGLSRFEASDSINRAMKSPCPSRRYFFRASRCSKSLNLLSMR